MHPNPIFRRTDQDRAFSYAQERAFGALVMASPGGVLVSHVPFVLRDGHADLHLVRSNPICRAAKEPMDATLIVSGPDAYVSPDWYGLDDQVPTWNYVAVHLTGALRPLPQEELEPLLVRQSAFFEDRLDKPSWLMEKLSDDTKRSLMRMILPFRFEVRGMESTFKLNQNKPDSARLSAADQMKSSIGQGQDQLAELMRHLPDMP